MADEPAPSPVTIPLTVTHTGGATAADYEGLPQSVTIQHGEDDVTILLRAVEDADDDHGEGFRVDFGELPAGVTAGTWATFEIVDNDGPRNAVLEDGWVKGSELTPLYTDPLGGDPALAGRDLVVVTGAAAGTVAVESVAVSGAEAVLRLARAVRPGEAVTLTYLAAPMHPLRTLGGGPAKAPTDFPVHNQASLVKLQQGLPARAQVNGLSAGTPPLPAALAAAEGAERLDLSGRGLTDLAPLTGLTGLRELDLRGNAITDIGPLAGLAEPRVLDLSGNALTDVAALGGLSALVWLRLPGNPIGNAVPLGWLPALRWLWLDPETAWADPLAPRSGPDERPALQVERTRPQERPGVN